jgi:6-pyruvoyltetrahydropterin/6-carboxytetrahydropterin synthase
MSELYDSGSYEITGEITFRAVHHLRTYRGAAEEPHEHEYRVRIALGVNDLDCDGIAFDFVELDGMLGSIKRRFDGCSLNDLPEFAERNPTAENLARAIAAMVASMLKTHATRLSFVEVFELAHMSARFYPR